jgi:GWxTD domain-containing protein
MRVGYPSPAWAARPSRPRRLASRTLRAATAALLLLALAAAPRAQVTAYEPDFDADVVAVRGADGTPQVDVYTSVPYQSVRFLARTGGFEASYTVDVEVYTADAQGNRQGLVRNRSWERSVQAPDYAATQAADGADRALQSLALEPGRYAVEVTVEDGASHRATAREFALDVPPADRPYALSDPLVLERYDRGSRDLHPSVGGVVRADQGSFTLYYEIYAEGTGDLRVTYTATDRSHVPARPSITALMGLSPRQRADRGVAFMLSEPIQVRPGRNPATLRVDMDQFRVGDYLIEVRLETTAGELLATATRPLVVRFAGMNAQVADLAQAISQLRYIARDREIADMRNAATDEERLRLFQAFWANRDPSPGTRRNERMEEYYARVAYANERYGRLRDQGWSTDRGEVYIRFGEPDFVESHPFAYGSIRPYEVWFYNRHGRRFIFVDETGGGDFRLLVPIWDERNRM